MNKEDISNGVQTYLPVSGVDPAEDDLSEKQIEFLKLLDSVGVKELVIGFAQEHDEGNIRHVRMHRIWDGQEEEHLDPDCGGWPSEVNMQDHDFWDLTDNVAADGMVHFHPIRKVIEAGMGLYITEPELRDDCGGEVDWNYHE